MRTDAEHMCSAEAREGTSRRPAPAPDPPHAAQGAPQSQPAARPRLWRPVTRFLGWWAGLSGFLTAFSVCPFCGQPGCAGGPVFAGVLGGIFAFVLAALRPGRRRLRAAHCEAAHEAGGPTTEESKAD